MWSSCFIYLLTGVIKLSVESLSFYSAPSEVVFSLLRASMTLLRVIPSQLLAAIADGNGNDAVESVIGGRSRREAARMFDMVPSTLTRQVKRARRKAL